MTRPLALAFALALALPATAQDDFQKHLATLQSQYSYLKKMDAIAAMKKYGDKGLAELRKVLLFKAPGHREKAAWTLASLCSEPDTRKKIQAMARDRKELVRTGVVWALRLSGDTSDETVAVYTRALRDPYWEVRSQAARAVAADKLEACKPTILKALRDRHPIAAGDMLAAAVALKVADEKTLATIDKMAGGGKPIIRAEALQALAALAADKCKARLEKAARDSKAEVRMGALYAMAALKIDDGLAHATKLLGDRDWRVRVTAIDTMVEWHDKRCIAPMCEQFAKEKGRLRYDFANALKHMTGMNHGYNGKIWKTWWEGAGGSFKMPPKPKKTTRYQDGMAGGGKEDGSYATFFGVPILSAAVVFAVDFSGSMRNDLKTDYGMYKGKKITKLAAAFEQLEKCLEQFRKDQKFSGVNISTECVAINKRYLSKVLVPATRSNRFRLLQEFKKVDEAMKKIMPRGRGDMWDAMEDATENIRGTDTIILITDGGPSDGKHLIPKIFVPEWKRYNKYRRVMLYTIVVDDTRWRSLMKDLVEATNGYYLDVTADPAGKKKKKRSSKKK